MTGFCKTKVPKDILSTLESIKDNDEAVKQFGIDLGTQMCRRILDSGVPGLHMYTLNTEVSSVSILENLGLINKAQVGASCCLPQLLPSLAQSLASSIGEVCGAVSGGPDRRRHALLVGQCFPLCRYSGVSLSPPVFRQSDQCW